MDRVGSMTSRRSRYLGRVILLALLFIARTAGRVDAISDHLECYRVADALALAGVIDVTLPALGLESGCTLGRGKLFCVPASETVVSATTPQLPVIGRALADARICYDIACPKRQVTNQEVTDQFGTRLASHLRPKLLCTPAVMGPPGPTADGLDDLACYRMRDPDNVSAVVNLDPDRLGAATDCRLSQGGRYSLFCTGASTDVRQVNVSPLLPIGGTRMDDDRICYSATCPRPFPADLEVSDRFGTRTLTRLVPRMLCGPATSENDSALGCQRAIESGGIAYAQAVLHAIDDCAATGQGESVNACFASVSARQRLSDLRTQWAAHATATCAATDLRHDLGYPDTCGAAPSACTAASVGVDGVVDCLACRFAEYLRGAAVKLYADRLASDGCRGVLGSGMQDLAATLQQVHECVNQPEATSVAACFTPNLAVWRARSEAACAGVDAFGTLGYPNLCSGNTPVRPSYCAQHVLPCTFSQTSSLSTPGEDNDLLDCLTCQAEEAVLGVARELYGANLCCVSGACNTILTRFACRAVGGTPVRYRVDSLRLRVPIFWPHWIQVGPDGFLYIADTAIKRVDRDTGAMTTVSANSGKGYGIAIDPSGTIYFTQRCNHRVYKLTPGGAISVLAGTGVPGHSGDEGPATLAQIEAPDGITLDSAGHVYFNESQTLAVFMCGAAARTRSERVRMVDTWGVIHTVAGGDFYGTAGEGGPTLKARLALPYRLRFAFDGSLLVGEDGAMRVLRIANGIINHIAGRVQSPLAAAHSGYGGPALRARFHNTCGLTGDLDGNVIVGPDQDSRVALVDRLGSVIGIAGTGEAVPSGQASGDGGPASLARGFCCEDLSVAADGRIYCSDLSTNSIRVLTREPF
jgi:hypothetical protein